MRRVICGYCNSEAELVEVEHGWRWVCLCGASVGAHSKSRAPLGTLANRELRLCRQALHQSFDLLWRKYKLGRSDAYQFMAAALGVPKKKAHIGAMDIDTCLKAAYEVGVALDKFKSSRREGREYVLGLVKERATDDKL